MLSVAAGAGASPVFGNGAGVGSGTFSAKTLAGLQKTQPAHQRHDYDRRAEFR